MQRPHRLGVRTSGAMRFGTLCFARLNREGHRLSFVNACPNPGILLDSEGGARMLDSTGPPVGLLEGAQFGIESADLPPGSLLCLYSDGITEAMAGDEFYGDERLLESLRAHAGRPLEEVASGVLGDLAAFLAGAPAGDDITILLVRRRAAPPSS